MSNTDYAEPDIQRQDGANTAKTPSILIAGVGNIFLGDDAFGVEVVHRLLRRRLPVEVEVSDFGIRGLDLAYALLDPYDVVILVDALPRGGRPGTVYVLEPSPEELAGSPEDSLVEAHALDPVKVLRLVAALGGQVRRLLRAAKRYRSRGHANGIERPRTGRGGRSNFSYRIARNAASRMTH